MPRVKRTARREPMEDIIYEEPPQDHPLEKYFKTFDDLNAYLITFADRKEIPPRKKVLVNVLTTEMRVLHYLLVYVIMPRSYGYGHIKDEDIITMWARIDVSGEARKGMVPTSVINTRTLHHMGRNLGEQEQEEQAQGPQEEAQAGPSEQPSMRDLMQMIQSLGQNMDNRFQRIEDNQTRMDRRF
ncbi:hypothetical protein PIB30_009804 [Stylosanthes scabra]|uniref:Uncharacterized protein n=1 Tax=Stylosanthes scabra TaxID=79078 RepID=A0ABU6Y723_9FABA|nr:hypothetical protein [Stylosanthes scabra]